MCTQKNKKKQKKTVMSVENIIHLKAQNVDEYSHLQNKNKKKFTHTKKQKKTVMSVEDIIHLEAQNVDEYAH